VATVYHTDDEAYELWTRNGGPAEGARGPHRRQARWAEIPVDNFWQMADTGPCGPCSEIFYDHGPGIEGGPPGSPDADGDRYIEIWNLVFMQFNRDEAAVMHPLPKPSVIRHGLERIAAVMQASTRTTRSTCSGSDQSGSARNASEGPQEPFAHVIADHIRACSFLNRRRSDPGHRGGGTCCADHPARHPHGYKLGQTEPFFHRLVGDLDQPMGRRYQSGASKGRSSRSCGRKRSASPRR